MPKCFLVVRATVADPGQRAAFDAWYRREHLPDAMRTFGAEKGTRFWSESDPSAHLASYRFASRTDVDLVLNSDGMKGLIAAFDRAWPGIPRTREILTEVEACEG